jgi:hypothetical protein
MRAFIVMRSLLWAALAAWPLLAVTAAQAEAPGGTQLAQSQSAAASGVGTLSPEAQSLYEIMQDNKPPPELVEQLYDDPGNARPLMINYLATGGTSAEERARRAAILAAGIIDSRRGYADPERRDQLIDTLLQLASEVVCSTKCIGTEIAEGYVPPASSFAYDFGGTASQVAQGFTLVTPDSAMFEGQVRDLEGLGTGALLYDANSGMTRIALNVPNGSYILRLFLPQGGTGEIFELRVNGTTHHVTWNEKSQWPAGSPLVSPASQGLGAPPVGGYACKMPMGARVAGGEVVLEFDGQPSPFPISGLELKPYDPLDDELGEDDCLLWDAAQRDAIQAYQEGGGRDDDPEIEIPEGCVGDCPVENPEEPSPAGAT